MALPNMSGTARLYADVELRFGATGTAVAKVPLVFNSRRKNQAGEWEDADSFFVTGTLFKERAEAAAEKLNRGDEVMVSGRLKTRSWEDQDGNKRSMTELMLDEVAPTLRTLTPKSQRQGSGQGGGFGQQSQQQGGGFGGQGQQGGNAPAGDPWATGGGGGFSDDPPPF
jgi:single-strand DNA-binding protein